MHADGQSEVPPGARALLHQLPEVGERPAGRVFGPAPGLHGRGDLQERPGGTSLQTTCRLSLPSGVVVQPVFGEQ